jgi:hypothetical protein
MKMELARGTEPPTCGSHNLSEPIDDTNAKPLPNKENEDYIEERF